MSINNYITEADTVLTFDLDRYDLAHLIQVIGEALASVATRNPSVSMTVTEYVNGTKDTVLHINDTRYSLPTTSIERWVNADLASA
jgi:hypothetical protein